MINRDRQIQQLTRLQIAADVARFDRDAANRDHQGGWRDRYAPSTMTTSKHADRAEAHRAAQPLEQCGAGLEIVDVGPSDLQEGANLVRVATRRDHADSFQHALNVILLPRPEEGKGPSTLRRWHQARHIR